MVVKNIASDISACAIEYYSESKYQTLRESRPVETRLKQGESKHFKFTNVDKKIKEVRIHLNKISG
jgi:hypothetical protein